MRYGRSVPSGFLPVLSVADEQEARDLITLACPTNYNGEHFARELANEQTIDNLLLFSDKLVRCHEIMEKAGRCRCKGLDTGRKTG